MRAPTEPSDPALFPLPAPRRRRPTRVAVLVGAAVVLLIGALAVHAAAGPSGASGLRTATVTTDTVDQTLALVGTVEPVRQAAVAFPVAGTVATVPVAIGQSVLAGDVLATLDGTSLQQAIDAQQSAVDQAKLTLANARSGGSSSAASERTASSGSTRSGGGTSSSGIDDAALAAKAQVLLDAQQRVDQELIQSQQLLETANRVCAAAGAATATTSTTSTTAVGDSSDAATPDPGDTTATTVDPNVLQACQRALQDVLDAQQEIHDDEADVSNAAFDYDQALETAQAAIDAAASSASTASSGGSVGAGSGGLGQGLGGSSGGASSADLIKDQAAVDAAEAQLAVAQQTLAQATIISPIDGTVAAVGLAPGDAVSASSTTATVVVVGAGGDEVTTTVGVDRIPDVHLGEAASVRPDGGHGTLQGKVVAIGPASTSSSGATTYPVTVSLPDGGEGLRNGSIASVTIVTKAASGALVVPTSAVHTTGTNHTVDVVDGGKVTPTPVRIGAMGSTWTQVTNGLRAGQRVVLADLSEPLPTSATQQQSNGRVGGFVVPAGFGGFRPGGGGGATTGRG